MYPLAENGGSKRNDGIERPCGCGGLSGRRNDGKEPLEIPEGTFPYHGQTLRMPFHDPLSRLFCGQSDSKEIRKMNLRE